MQSQKSKLALTFFVVTAIAIIAVGNLSAAVISKKNYTPDVHLMVTPEPSNEFIQIAVRNDGTFTFGKGDGTKLLYGHPDPWSSATTIRIDGVDHWNFGDNSIGNVISGPKLINGNSNQIVWEIGNIQLNQILTIVEGNNGDLDTVKIQYLVVNNDSSPHQIGLRTMLDTMIGGNDNAPFKLANGDQLTKEQEYSADAVPEFWEAFENLTAPDSLSAQGVLTRGTPRLPDRVVFGLWGAGIPEYMADSPWDYTPSELDFGDSAVGLYWNPIEVAPGETAEYVTYYGNGVIVGPGDLISVLNCTNRVDRNLDNTLTPSPFAITANIANKPDVSPVTNVVTTLTLGAGLELVSGDAQRNNGDLAAGEEVLLNWEVRALDQEPYGPDNPRSISIETTCNELDPITASREVVVATNVFPQMSIDPSEPIEFGDVSVGQDQTETFTISNDASATGNLNVDDITTDCEAVTIDPTNFVLAPGEDQVVDVTVHFSRIDEINGFLTIESNDLSSPTRLDVSARGVEAVISVDELVDFDEIYPDGVQVGQTKEATLIIGNIGNIPLEIASITSSLPNVFGTAVSILTDPVLTVPAQEERELTVTFTPAAEQEYNGTLTFDSNSTSKEVDLHGTGFPPQPEIVILEPPIVIVDEEEKRIMDFDKVKLGQFGEATLTIKNNGLADLTITNFSFTNLVFSATVPGTIASGEEVDVPVKFTPTVMGEATGTLTIQSNDSSTDAPVIDLVGFGIDAILVLSPIPIDFGIVDIDSSATRILTIENTGNAELEVTELNIGEVSISVDTPIYEIDDAVQMPFIVVPGTTKQIPVIFTTRVENAGQTCEATLTIVNDSRSNPNATVELTGEVKDKPVEVAITSPICGGKYNGMIPIFGTAKARDGVKQWQLYIAEGDQTEWVPSAITPQLASWNFLDEGTTELDDEHIFDLDTTQYDDDLYTLRLDVTPKGTQLDRKWALCLITIDNTPPTIHSLVLTSEPGGELYSTDGARVITAGTVSTETERVISATLHGSPINVPIEIFDPATSSISHVIDDIGQLVSGEIWLELEIADDVGNTVSGESNRLTVDNSPPTVTINNPCFNANSQVLPIQIDGEAVDDRSEVHRVEITFDVLLEGPKRVWYPVDLQQDGSWNFSFKPEISNSYTEFKVKVTDVVGNIFEQEYRRILRYKDYRPDLNIISPLDGSRFVFDAQSDGEIQPVVDPDPYIVVEGMAGKNSPDVGYLLEYAEGADATDDAKWHTIVEKDSVSQHTHFFQEEWHIRNLNGVYTLRLTSGDHSVVRTNIVVASGRVIGDVNYDGYVDTTDAMSILRHVVGHYQISEDDLPFVDVSDNGVVSAYDAALIFQFVRQLILEFPRTTTE